MSEGSSSEPGSGTGGTARSEAERLVAAALATASMAARGADGFATGSAECCVCPVCRTIAAMRESDPAVAERLAGGAGDLAAAVASLLRSLSGPAGSRPAAAPGEPGAGPGERRGDTDRPDDDPWRAATRG